MVNTVHTGDRKCTTTTTTTTIIIIIVIIIITVTTTTTGPGSVVGIATAYGLDGPGIESR